MISNYFTIAYRNLVRNKIYSLINICGLALGMAACFYIFQFVHFEADYDTFNTNSNRIYRVPLSYNGSNSGMSSLATNSPAVTPAMKKEFPEVADFTRVVNISIFLNTSMLTYQPPAAEPKSFFEKRLFLADGSFFNIFSYHLISGNPSTCLRNKQSIVLTKTLAVKYFGNSDPVGQTLQLNQFKPLQVTGVMDDVPENSHLQFDALVSFSTWGENWGYDEWDYPEFYNYVLLAPNSDPVALQKKMPAFIQEHMDSLLRADHYSVRMNLQPVTDIHLNGRYEKDAQEHANKGELSLIGFIGIFILVIAWINYINLATARSLERAREVGVRKVVGAAKIQLFTQFLIESVLVNSISFALAVMVVIVAMPFFHALVGKNITAGFLTTGLGSQPRFWMLTGGLFLGSCLLVGCYPAIVLSSFRPVAVFKGRKINHSKFGISLRKAMVAFQFMLSIILIAATGIIYRQIRFMQQGDLGYKQDQVMILKSPAIDDYSGVGRFDYFKNAVTRIPAVIDAAASSDIPGAMIRYQNGSRRLTQARSSNFDTNLLEIDEHFIETYQIPLTAGRNFTAADTATIRAGSHINVLVNDLLAKGLGFGSGQAAVGQTIICMWGTNDVLCKIVGVIGNFHQRSLKERYEPILCYYPWVTDWKYISIHLNKAGSGNDINSIRQLFTSTFPGSPFEHFFLNDYFNRQYLADQRLANVLFLFAVIAIGIACLGLLGLSSFVIRLRIREIGIRKVLGASVKSILLLFSKDYIQLILIASVIAIPVVYYAAFRWLENFPFRMNLAWFLFAAPPVLLLIVSLITICLQTIKAALTNPVESLRNE